MEIEKVGLLTEIISERLNDFPRAAWGPKFTEIPQDKITEPMVENASAILQTITKSPWYKRSQTRKELEKLMV